MQRPAQHRLVGIDLDKAQLAYATAFRDALPGFQNCEFRSGDVTSGLPLGDGTLDIVSVADVNEHLPDPVGVLREVPNGIAIVTPVQTTPVKRPGSVANRITRGPIKRANYRRIGPRTTSGTPSGWPTPRSASRGCATRCSWPTTTASPTSRASRTR